MVSSFTDLSLIVKSNVLAYSQNSLEKFSEIYRHSVLSNLIDSVDPAIKSNITKVKMIKLITPMLNKSTTYDIKFGNSIKLDGFSIMSSYFNVAGTTERIMLTNRGNDIVTGYYNVYNNFVVVSTVGTIDYANGNIKINDMIITYAPEELKMFAVPLSNDIVARENNICMIRSSDIKVTMLIDSVTNRMTVAS